MNSDEVLKLVKRWSKEIGQKEAIKRLVVAELSSSMSQQLVYGTYKHTLSYDNANTVLAEMAKDGVSPAGEAS